MARFEKFVKLLSKGTNWIAASAMLILMASICVAVVAHVCRHEIYGALELGTLLAVIIAAFAVADAQVEGAHVSVEVLMQRMPKRIQLITSVINSLLLAVLSVIVSWQCIVTGSKLLQAKAESVALGFPFYTLYYGIAVGFAILGLVFLVEVLRLLFRRQR